MVQVRRHARSRSACSERALCYRVGSEVSSDRSGYRAFFERRRTAVSHEGMVHRDVRRVIEIVRQYGKLKLLDDYDLVVETDGELEMTSLAEKLAEAFGEEMGLERYVKKKLD